MLHELRVENLLLIERAELRLAPGLNVLTGETGAGKTMLAHALDLLLGGRAGSGIVRPGASEAYVEGVFDLPAELDPELAERLGPDREEIVLARRVWPDGRTRAYVCGRAATVGDLRELGGELLAFYGQHEHRRLMLASAQLDVLDAHCGPEHLSVRARVAAVHQRRRALEERLAELRALAGARERELDLLTFELEEIETANPSEEEQASLVAERDRLRHSETITTATAAAAEALAPESGGPGAGFLLAQAVRTLDPVAALDPDLTACLGRLQAALYETEDLGAELRRRAFEVDASPGRLEEVEDRLALLARLGRKHGGSIAAVLEHAERCVARREELTGAEVALEEIQAEIATAETELGALAATLSEARREAAPRLAEAVRRRLADLAMDGAEFEVELTPRPDGCGPAGAETVELMIAPNPGVSAGPLREIASGGELSRVMLALLSAAHAEGSQAGPAAPLLVFDEVDAGIGGHTARAVGEHLRALARGRQVLCITHLPQVASLAERHFRISKSAAGETASTDVLELGGDLVVAELVRMLGAAEDDRAASQHARKLLRAA
ncbi:MAG TPA: DNA repair protein RecN [Solirubrobacteraceae bacterium]|jgi:DNA repair protein RecN (Recombination protein N)|nr:DNA repair protein RecN [Solirubrobacteraceae bacterium]